MDLNNGTGLRNALLKIYKIYKESVSIHSTSLTINRCIRVFIVPSSAAAYRVLHFAVNRFFGPFLQTKNVHTQMQF